jgi:hypothetical protein
MNPPLRAGFIFVLTALSAPLTMLIVVRCARVSPAAGHKQQFPILSDQVPMPADTSSGTGDSEQQAGD